jgi:hypothetical protein
MAGKTLTIGKPSVSNRLSTSATASDKVGRKLARKSARQNARKVVRTRLAEIPEKDGLRAAIITLVGDGTRSFGGGNTGETKLSKFVGLFANTKSISSIDAFKAMKIGISEGKKLIRKNDKLNKGKTEYKAIVYDAIADVYKIS